MDLSLVTRLSIELNLEPSIAIDDKREYKPFEVSAYLNQRVLLKTFSQHLQASDIQRPPKASPVKWPNKYS